MVAGLASLNMKIRFTSVLFAVALYIQPALADEAAIRIDRTEVTIAAFADYVAATGTVTKAEISGGMVYEAGWTSKPGWNWRTPYGVAGLPAEPAVHITYDEAAAYCAWRGARLPTRDEWITHAYTEFRATPPSPLVKGRTYPYPTGDTPEGANCLGDCGNVTGNPAGKADYADKLMRGHGHAVAGSTVAGVNGLYDMGANVWEWATSGNGRKQATMGGSWWYGKAQMKADYGATKPRDMAIVYIGFRCIRDD